jgi:protein-S-isoprenylcysteine O-methyltransferase Ste14
MDLRKERKMKTLGYWTGVVSMLLALGLIFTVVCSNLPQKFWILFGLLLAVIVHGALCYACGEENVDGQTANVQPIETVEKEVSQ